MGALTLKKKENKFGEIVTPLIFVYQIGRISILNIDVPPVNRTEINAQIKQKP